MGKAEAGVERQGPGTYIWNPRNVSHTFWNASVRVARLIEICVPAGIEHFFQALAEAGQTAKSPAAFAERRIQLGAEYNISMVPEWIPELAARYYLKLMGET